MRPKTQLTLSPQEKKILLTLFPRGVVAFDLEMTGLTPVVDKIIEIAAIKLGPEGKISTFHQLVNPLVEISEQSVQFHKITNDAVRDKPSIKEPLKRFVEFFGDMPLIAHNARFDAAFIVKAMHEFNYPFSLSDIYDSCMINRSFYKKNTLGDSKPASFKLSELASFYQFDFTHHQAMDDAIVSLKTFAQCALALESKLSEKNSDAVNDTKKLSSEIKSMGFLFKLNSFQKREEYILSKKHLPLIDYARERVEIEIIYQGGRRKNVFRPITPIAILPMPTGMVLYALCLLEDKHKYFKLKKIKAFKKADKSQNSR